MADHKNCKYYADCDYRNDVGVCPDRCVQYKHRDDVRVVRCKDCKFGEHSINAIGEPSIACNNPDVGFYEWLLGEDDFCSYGERREGE